MKKIFTIIILGFNCICYSQKHYEFDYVIEYDVIMNKDSIKLKNHHFREFDKKFKKYYLTNSKNNEYFAVITEKDSLNYNLTLIDHKGFLAKVEFFKSELNEAEFININCKNVIITMNPFIRRNYELIKLKDTMFNDKFCFKYKYGLKKIKKREKEKRGFDYYIIDKSSSFHLPLLTFPNIFAKWSKNKKKLPNGIINERYYIDFYGKLRTSEKFVTYRKTDKKIYLPKPCGYKEFLIK